MRFTVQFTGKLKSAQTQPVTLSVNVDASVLAKLDPTSELYASRKEALQQLDKLAKAADEADGETAREAAEQALLAARRNVAWDEFKRQTGLRRWAGDTAPVIEPVEDRHDGHGTDEPQDGPS